MIDPKELRIGNLLKKGGAVIKVDAQTIVKIDDIGLAAGYEPVELTEEWLLKMGFRKLDTYSFVNNSIFIYDRKRGFVYGSINLDLMIESVHQLQNLYFALTRKELTIKQ